MSGSAHSVGDLEQRVNPALATLSLPVAADNGYLTVDAAIEVALETVGGAVARASGAQYPSSSMCPSDDRWMMNGRFNAYSQRMTATRMALLQVLLLFHDLDYYFR